MSWNPPPNQGQDPNQQGQYGGYSQQPPQPTDPYSGQQGGYQQSGYGQQQYGQPGGAPPTGGASPLGPSSIGMDPKVAAGLGYLVGIIGIIFFFMEKQSRFVRFHALQSIFLIIGIIALVIVYFVLSIVAAAANSGALALVIFCVIGLAYLALFVGWLIAMIQAFMGKYFKLPVIGDFADRYAGQGIPRT